MLFSWSPLENRHTVLMVTGSPSENMCTVLMLSLREQTRCSCGLPLRTDMLISWSPSENRHVTLVVSLREQSCHSRHLPQRTDMSFSSSPSENRRTVFMVSLREQTRLCPDRETASKVCQLARADTHCVQDKLLLPEHYSSLAHVLCACCILLLHLWKVQGHLWGENTTPSSQETTRPCLKRPKMYTHTHICTYTLQVLYDYFAFLFSFFLSLR